jgi:glycerol-3-phosphate dehydrogenase (NAD(P)+)
MAGDDLVRYHERIRRRGVHPLVYWLTRVLLQPAIQLYFRLSRTGREHIPEGPVLLAANHRSFLDPFLVGLCLRRPVYFVAKRELFERRLTAWFLCSLGAFPIRRGESDEQAMATAIELLGRGEAVVIFPEGTRVRTGPPGSPKRGVGRLVLDSGAPVVPVAVAGSERARRGWRIRPTRVRVRCGRPLTFPRVEQASPRLALAVTSRIWPCVELHYAWLAGITAPSEQGEGAAPERRAA